jgi:hypothetical protein
MRRQYNDHRNRQDRRRGRHDAPRQYTFGTAKGSDDPID